MLDLKRKLPLSMVALALVTALVAFACSSSKKEEGTFSATPPQPAASATVLATSGPTQPAIFATATATQRIDTIIKNYLLDGDAARRDVIIQKKTYYTDSSGTDWIMFAFSLIPVGVAESGYGVMKELPGGHWATFGPVTDPLLCTFPAEVKIGLGLGPPDCPVQNVDAIIRDYVLGRSVSSIKWDITIEGRHYYTDSSGTDWIMFTFSPIPEGILDPGYGIMKELPGGNWEMIGPMTGPPPCSVPADVKRGLGLRFGECPTAKRSE